MNAQPQVIIPLKDYEELQFRSSLASSTGWVKVEMGTIFANKGADLIIRSKSAVPDMVIGNINEEALKLMKGYKLCIFKEEVLTTQ